MGSPIFINALQVTRYRLQGFYIGLAAFVSYHETETYTVNPVACNLKPVTLLFLKFSLTFVTCMLIL